MSSKSRLKARLHDLKQRLKPATVLDDPSIDSDWIYALGDPGWEADWLRDPAWVEVAHDEWVTVYQHTPTKAKRAVYRCRLSEDDLQSRSGQEFL